MYADVVPSTQTILYEKLPGVQMGLLCVADVQDSGKNFLLLFYALFFFF